MVSLNGKSYTDEEIFTEEYYPFSTDIILEFDLGFYKRISNIQYTKRYTLDAWQTYQYPDTQYAINGNLLTVISGDKGVLKTVYDDNSSTYWKVTFVDDYGHEAFIIITFLPVSK